MDIVLATHNHGKVSELRSILAAQLGPASGKINLTTAEELGVPDPVETGVTFEENALLKARFVAQHTGLLSIADDSGLIVDIFGAAPGILSARWAGMHGDDAANNALLLAQLSDIDDAHRGAAFECCAAMVVPAGVCGNDEEIEICRHGEMRGRILREPYGSNGFGYDPIFAPDDAQVLASHAGTASDVASVDEMNEMTGGAGVSAGASGASALDAGDSSASGSTATVAAAADSDIDGANADAATDAATDAADNSSAVAASRRPIRRPITSADLTAEQKNAISHRGKAMRALAEEIAKLVA